MVKNKLLLINLFGNPRERGRIYGELARDPIAEVWRNWVSTLSSFVTVNRHQKLDGDGYWKEFLEQTFYIKAIRRWVPELLEEIEGIAEGANQPFEKILALQLIDEEWVYSLHSNNNRPSNKCTAFGISDAKASTFAGQNMDVPHWMEGFQTLLRIQLDNGSGDAPPLEALVFTVAGVIGLNGINSSPLGVTCNTLAQLQSSRQGLPVSFIVRKILSMRNIEEATRFLQNVSHASGQNYMLSTKEDVRCFECSANQVAEYQEQAGNSITHTNHPLKNTDISDVAGKIKGRLSNSTQRLRSISHRLNTVGEPALPHIQQALSAHDDPDNPVCRCVGQGLSDQAIGYTAGSSIYEYGLKTQLHLAAGPPCSTAFRTFEFN